MEEEVIATGKLVLTQTSQAAGVGTILRAACQFGALGSIDMTERVTPPLIVTASRSIDFLGNINGLCPFTLYSFSVHQFNNIKSKCKNVGPLIGRQEGLITQAMSDKFGFLKILATDKPFTLLLTTGSGSRPTLLGGSCILKGIKTGCGGHRKCKKRCPMLLCSPILLKTLTV